jgi:NADPH-dependent 2,4-dienoyl-CoA reductase/sulfur reductase-like enzyme
MREAITRNPLAALLKECYIRPHPRCKAQQYSPSRTVLWKRSFASTPSLIEHEVNNVAVLGGGISGLASAFYLSEKLPNAKITIYEASPRLGGWLQSQSVDVGTGKIVFEQGPRTLRPSVPNGMATLDLVSIWLPLDEVGV